MMPTTIPVNPAAEELRRLESVLASYTPRIIACSGGIDSLLLATLAWRADPAHTRIAHAISPAVPEEATARVRSWAGQEGWDVDWVQPGEFSDECYLSNPVNRCYYCKSNLYQSLQQLSLLVQSDAVLMSGANLDDLGEYRPGLTAAAEHAARHPYIEANIDKGTIRDIARYIGLPFSEIPASPCLASRLYTGTRVTGSRLKVIEEGELLLRRKAKLSVVRCRLRENEILVEVGADDRHRVTEPLLQQIKSNAADLGLAIDRVLLDPLPYSPGRAFVAAQ